MATITLTGNVGTEPELKFIKGRNGDFAVCSFSVGENERVKDANGNWVNGDPTWYRVSILGRAAENATEIQKGDRILITGSFKQSSYVAKDGTTKTNLEIKAESFGIVPKTTNKPKVEEQEDWSAPWSNN